jgi:hypothetical protein
MFGLFSVLQLCFLSWFWWIYFLMLALGLIFISIGVARKKSVFHKSAFWQGGIGLFTLCQILFISYQQLKPPVSPPPTSPSPVILDVGPKIMLTQIPGFWDIHVQVSNKNVEETAKNCQMQIEHRYPGQDQYEPLGDALLQPPDLHQDSKTFFWLVRSRSYKGADWEIWIVTGQVKQLVEQGKPLPEPPTFKGAGEHELRLRVRADNGESPAHEFKLTIFKDTDKPPVLELLR